MPPSSHHRSNKRRGAVAAELATVLPLLALITFGSIQVANTIHFKQALTTAAFEGTRASTGPSITRAQIEARVNAVLNARRIIGATVSITPAGEIFALPPRTQIAITITAPISGNVTGPSFVTLSDSITVTGRTIR